MKTIKYITTAVACMLMFWGCQSDKCEGMCAETPNSQLQPRSKKNRVIYEVNVYAYSAEANFKGLERDIPRLKDLGVDIIWLMPIHPIGEVNRQGELGSPYGVRDYKALNPDFGTEDDFRSLVDNLHANGMELWMDWVANHTAWDNVWNPAHLEYYAEKDGVKPYAPPGWPDVIQLDHSNPDLLEAMADAMIYWVREFDVDGFRCDAADFVPLDFWRGLRSRVDEVKVVTWLSEGWETDYLEVFDYDYAWQFGESLIAFGKDGDMSKLVEACKDLHRNTAYKDKGRMVYITNHDLNAYEGSEFTRYGDNVMALTVLSYTIYDMPLIYNGQEIGMDKAMNFAEMQPVEWNPTNKQYVNLHKRLTHLKRTQPALEDGTNRGKLTIHATTQENVLAFSRTRGDNEVLVLLNLGSYATRFWFSVNGPVGKFRNYIDDTTIDIGADTGISLRENGYAVYVK